MGLRETGEICPVYMRSPDSYNPLWYSHSFTPDITKACNDYLKTVVSAYDAYFYYSVYSSTYINIFSHPILTTYGYWEPQQVARVRINPVVFRSDMPDPSSFQALANAVSAAANVSWKAIKALGEVFSGWGYHVAKSLNPGSSLGDNSAAPVNLSGPVSNLVSSLPDYPLTKPGVLDPRTKVTLMLVGEQAIMPPPGSNDIYAQPTDQSLSRELKALSELIRAMLNKPTDPADLPRVNRALDLLELLLNTFGATIDLLELGTDLIGAVPRTITDIANFLDTPLVKTLLRLLDSLDEDPIREIQDHKEKAAASPDLCCTEMLEAFKSAFLKDDLSPFYTTPEGLGIADVVSVPSEPFPPFAQDSWPD